MCISATVPLGMFGVTEPCSEICFLFDSLEFLDLILHFFNSGFSDF